MHLQTKVKNKGNEVFKRWVDGTINLCCRNKEFSIEMPIHDMAYHDGAQIYKTFIET